MRIERRVPLLVSSRIDVPALVGWRTPAILLPARALERMSQPEIEAMLAHELAHLRRWDRWTKALGQVVRSLLFFHPVAHRLLGRLDTERELACDDVAVAACGSPVLYARALASLEHARQEKAMRILAADGAPLLSRVRRIVDPGTALHDRVGRAFAIAGIAALFFLAQGSTAPPHLAGPCLPDVIADRMLAGHMTHAPHSMRDGDVLRFRDVRRTPHKTDP
jgi:beta-lactamase regulating signal transducer with metallopeptidase domain